MLEDQRPSAAAWRLILITDRRQAKPDFLQVIREVCAAGIDAVQLREKDLSDKELLLLAQRVQQVTRAHRVPLIINSNIAVALAVGADGIHLGGRSLPIDIARRLVGTELLTGASTHNLEEVRVANELGADYLTFGPTFDTPSKRGLVSTTGLDPIKELKQSTSLPIFALGGVKRANLPDVLAAGFDGAAVISEIMASERPGHLVAEMRSIVEEHAMRVESSIRDS